MAGFANRLSATRDIKHALRDILGCDAIKSGGDEYDIAGALQRRLGSLSIRGNPLQGGCRHSCEANLHQGFVSGDLRIEGRSVESCSNFSSLRASSSVAHQVRFFLAQKRDHCALALLSLDVQLVLRRFCQFNSYYYWTFDEKITRRAGKVDV